MEEKLIQYLDEIVQALKQGAEFAGEQAPIFIQEVLNYYTFYYGVLLGIFALVFLMAVVFAFHFYSKKDYDYFFALAPFYLFAFFGVIYNVVQIGKIMLAPRLFLIEQISQLL